MKTRTVLTSAIVVVALVGIAASLAFQEQRIRAMENRLAGVTAGMEPIHTRCEVLEGLLDAAKENLANVEEASMALSGTVANHATLLSEDTLQLREIEQRLLRAREEANARSSAIQMAVEEQIQAVRAAEKRVADLATQLEELEDQRDLMPAGTILPWLPRAGGVPPGWLLCDGSRGAPDLRGLFLRGVGRLGAAGRMVEASTMQPAGVHSHATDPSRSIFSINLTTPREPGNWLALFDAGIGKTDPGTLATHGSHVHEDEHVPAHFTVVFIMKDSG